MIARLNEEGETDELKEQLDNIEHYFMKQAVPLDFDESSPDNAALKVDQNFEMLCTVLESNGVTGAATLSTLSFYSRLEFFRRQQKPAPEANNKP